jgi:tetratricopeptide (TPR) repeat protein
MPDLRDESLARALIESLGPIALDALSEEELTQLEVTKAQLLYHAGDRQASLQTLEALVLRFVKRGVINSTLADVYTGLGAIRCHEGRYNEARQDFNRAYSVFSRIGNEAGQTNIAAQIALCCGRLGDYGEQIAWSRRASLTQTSSVIGYNQLQLAYYEAFALAMKGDLKPAIDRIGALDECFSSFSTPWLVQAWKLAKADIYYLSGHQAVGLALAKEGTHYPRPILHATGFAGAFARWLALIERSERRGIVGEHVERLEARLDQYDALDQVEILLAHLACKPSQVASPTDVSQLLGKTQELPESVFHQLRRLGLSDEAFTPGERATSYSQAK